MNTDYIILALNSIIIPLIVYIFFSIKNTLKTIELNTQEIINLKKGLEITLNEFQEIADKFTELKEELLVSKESLKAYWVKYEMLMSLYSDLKDRIKELEKRTDRLASM